MFDADLQNHQSRIDRLQIAALCGLMVLGAMFVYSATMENGSAGLAAWYNQVWFRQIIWYAIGTGAAAGLCCVDYHTVARWSMIAYWFSVFLLAVVLFFGTVRFGARRWFDLGFFSLQPSELAELALSLALPQFLSRPVEELRVPLTFWKALGLMMLPFVLILKEPDLGSALVLLPAGLAMLFVAGTPRRYLVWMFACVGIMGALFVADVLFMPVKWQVNLEEYQRRRLLVYFGTQDSPPAGVSKADRARLRRQQLDYSHNVRQALISVGSGGLTGKGWRQGTQNALGYLPRSVAHNDFIFSVIAEESGFVGSVIVLTLY